MTETRVKELFDQLVDGGAPPGVRVPVSDVLARNGMALRRRRLRRTATAGLAMAAAAGLVILLPNLPGSRAAPTSPAAPPTATATARPSPTPRLFPEAESRKRAERMLDRLIAEVPAGFTLPKYDNTAPTGEYQDALRYAFWRRDSARKMSETLSEAMLEVQLSGRAAMLTFRAVQVSPPVSSAWPATPDAASLCNLAIDEEERRDCKVIYAKDGSPVRLSWWKTAAGPTRQAIRFYEGTYVMVQQASRPREGVYGLGRPVFTDQQLVELAADPAFEP